MESGDILEQLFDEKILRILRFFFSNDKSDFYLREISKRTSIPVASTFRIVNKLVVLKIIEQQPIKKFKLYKLGDNENTRFLGQLIKKEKQAMQVFITRVKVLEGLKQVLLQGKEEEDKANLILIGDGIDQGKVKELCGTVKNEYNFRITALVLQEEQFKQMDEMGLYPGKKQVMFKR